MAEIVQDPELRYTSDTQTPIAKMKVQFSGSRPDDPPAILDVVGWGNLAQEIQERYQKGDRVILEGRLSMNTIDRPEGFKEKRAELTVQRIYALGTDTVLASSSSISSPTESYKASTTKSSATTPSIKESSESFQVPAAPETDSDFDEIPFLRPVVPVACQIPFGDDLMDSDIHRPRVGFEFRKFSYQ
jgi:single-stranded DNA-binding protein